MTRLSLPQGAEVTAGGVRYCVWAPDHKVAIQVFPEGDVRRRTIPLFRDHLGYHHGVDERGRAGDRYFIQLDGDPTYPCPASRWQPDGVNGPSMVIDPCTFTWTDE